MYTGRFKIVEIYQKDEWQRYFIQTSKYNLSQDWEYGEFRKATSKWQVRRFKVLELEKVVGIFQCYEKSLPIFSFLGVVYINRGPLLLEEFSNVRFGELLHFIKKQFSILNGKTLILSPFKELSQELIEEMRTRKFIQMFTNTYVTSYLNLIKSEDQIRKELHSKWRNQLNSAEKKSISFIVDRVGDYDDFILETYSKMSNEKGFDTITNIQLRTLFSEYRKSNNLFVFVGLNEFNEPLSFKIFIGYGESVVYFIGWASLDGRQANAPKLLIWNAIKYLKSKGYTEMDLGGMDPINLPGIAKFKQGLGGTDATFIERWISII
jgi:lipid II:glycine glycyltransferase (peptidoglycan interpeptide bridge formation enzyme)